MTRNNVDTDKKFNKCPKCGADILEGDLFCTNCGERIKQ